VNSEHRVKFLHAIHPAYDDAKLRYMKALILERGAPRIRVVDCGDHYFAIEGSHRLAAAADLGVVPCLIVLSKNDHVDLDSTDIGELFELASKVLSAGEIVAECRSHHNPVFSINADGTLTPVLTRQPEEE
jgi:hypothetical protein